MRRKLFFYSLLLLIITIAILSLNNAFGDETTDILTSDKYEAKVISLQKTEKGYEFLTKLPNNERILLKYYGNKEFSQKSIGATISFTGLPEIPKEQRNPKGFNYRIYLMSIGIEYIATAKDIEIKSFSNNYYYRYCQFLLSKKEAFLESIRDDNSRNFVEGILFGNTDNLEESVYEEFKQNGTAHILAVSGLHIGIVYQTLQKLLGKRLSLYNFVISTALLWSLAILTGWTPSVIRASGMLVLKNIALYTDKRYDSLTSLSLISICMIIKNPYTVFNVSFQMSFLAVISIIFITPHLSVKIPEFLTVILSVNIGLIPYQMFQFNTFSITSFVANIPIVYLAGIMLPIAFLQFVFFMITGTNMGILMEAFSQLVIYINKLCTLNLETINVASPPLWLIIIFYGVGFFLISETFFLLKSRKKYRFAMSTVLIICILAFCANSIYSTEFDDADIVFLDVGQGDCLHLKAGDKDILIDGGGSIDYNVGRNTVMPYLLKNGVRKVDLAVATHLHTDHYKGLKELQDSGLVDDIKVGLCRGKVFKIDENIWIETLWPIENSTGYIDQDENKNCSVFLIHYKGKRILVTGDLDMEGEAQMIKYYGGSNALKADILKLGHHGSQYSTSDEFLNQVDPKYCVIQVGKNNYGHPHTKIIEKCEEKCIMILRNDIHGAIGFSFDDNNIEYCTMIKTDGR